MKRARFLFFISYLFITIRAIAQPHYHYITYLPQCYDSSKHKHWPLIIYLHGKSACGNDLSKVRRYGLPFFTDRGMQLNAIALSPQCPDGKNWGSEDWLNPFLKEVNRKYRVDTTRIYLTGMSLGGFGTWELAIRYPGRFAAIAPLCGGGKPQQVCAIKDVPIWVFHGDQDEQVPISRSEEMVNALRKCGGNPKFTVLKGFPHDIHKTYGDESLYKWMLQYSLNSRQVGYNKTLTFNDTIVKAEKGITKVENKAEVKEKAKVTEKSKKSKKTNVADSPVRPNERKHKPAKEAQTDTIKGKDFILVF